MADEPKPEADALEQSQALIDNESDFPAAIDDPEAPEADRLDQKREAWGSADEGVRSLPEDPEVPEADAAEQERAVIDSEENRPD